MGYEHIDVEVYQFCCEFRETVVSTLSPPILENNVVALLVSELAETRSQRVDLTSVFRVRRHAQKADPVYFPGPLPARHEWPCGRHATEKCDELAPLHVPSARDYALGYSLLALCGRDERKKRRIIGSAD
jgi:hypothetical protein